MKNARLNAEPRLIRHKVAHILIIRFNAGTCVDTTLSLNEVIHVSMCSSSLATLHVLRIRKYRGTRFRFHK